MPSEVSIGETVKPGSLFASPRRVPVRTRAAGPGQAPEAVGMAESASLFVVRLCGVSCRRRRRIGRRHVSDGEGAFQDGEL